MGDLPEDPGGLGGSSPASPNPNISETVNPAPSPQTSEPKQEYEFSSLGYKFSTQMINGKKIVSSFVSVFLLLAGLGAGVVLVSQPQLFQKKAEVNQNVSTPACDESQKCTTDAVNAPVGSHPCLTRNGVAQCCPKGEVVVNNTCTNASSLCDISSKCSLNSRTYGAHACSNSEGQIYFCCARGESMNETLGFCYKLPF